MSRAGPTSHPEDAGSSGTDERLEPTRIVSGAVGAKPLFGPRQVVSLRAGTLRDEIDALEREVERLRAKADQLVAARLLEAEIEIERQKAEARSAAVSAASDDVARALDSLRRSHDGLLQWLDDKLQELCIAMARKILRLELADSTRASAAWRGLIGEAMRRVRRQSAVTIRVHPEFATVIERVAAEMAASDPMAAVPTVMPDREVDLGEAVVVTAAGRIEVSIERALLGYARDGDPREGGDS